MPKLKPAPLPTLDNLYKQSVIQPDFPEYEKESLHTNYLKAKRNI